MIKLKKVVNYLCDQSTPTDDEIEQCIHIAYRDHCIVRLSWSFPYSGWYELHICEGMTVEECKERLPKVYPV